MNFAVYTKDGCPYCDKVKKVFISMFLGKNSCNLLFSPGYPSGDDFKDFNERGERFNALAINK